MEWLSAWWIALSTFEKVLWCIAIPFTLLTFLQVILEILGAGDHGADSGFDGADTSDMDFDHDFDHDGADAGDLDGAHHMTAMRLFTVKGFIIFFTAFGWMTLASYKAGLPGFIAGIIGAAVGVACMFLFAWIFQTLARLSETGTVLIKNALYKKGTAYLRIPANREGRGKIHVVVQGSTREYEAVTDGDEISTGTTIQVIDIIDNDTVVVSED
jgi:hypothetical protein